MTPILSVPMTVEVPWDVVTNAIVGALEGGYSPWMHAFLPSESPDSQQALHNVREEFEGPWYAEEAYWQRGTASLQYDLADEGEGEGNGSMTIGKDEITKGLAAMAQKAPRHFADLIGENDDAITHDVFMQMIVFGETIYG